MRSFDLGPVSAYAIARAKGFEGTVEEWLASLSVSDAKVAAYLRENPRVLQQVNPVRGSVATAQDLPKSAELNDTYYVQADRYLVTWTGTQWVQSSMDEAAFTGELAELRDLVGRLEGGPALTWAQGNLNNSTGASTGTSSTRIRSGFFPLGDYVVWPDEGYSVFPYFYNEQGTYLPTDVNWSSNITNLRSIAPSEAAQCRLVAASGVSNTLPIAPSEGFHIRIFVRSEVRFSDMQTELDEYAKDLSDNLFPEEITDFQTGGIYVDQGREWSSTARLRTGFHRLGRIRVTWVPCNFQYIVLYYDQDQTFLEATEWIGAGVRTIQKQDVENAAYVRFLVWNAVLKNNFDFSDHLYLPDGCVIRIGDEAAGAELIQSDMPHNLGAINVQLRALQIMRLQYTLAAKLPAHNTVYNAGGQADIAAGRTISGVPYSSSRKEENFVPQTVSFHTLMTAAKNPNSYFYTRVIDSSEVGGSRTYYGIVCSTFVDHCYGIKGYIPTTYQIEHLPGMERVDDQSAYGAKIGDLLSREKKHVGIIFDIVRNRSTGRIVSITIAESAIQLPKLRTYTPEEFLKRITDEKLVLFRWRYLYNVDYEPSPWVHLEKESEEPVYCRNLCPRRGDKANWRPGETVEVDILDPGGYSEWVLYKGDEEYQRGSVSGSLLRFPDLGYGKYKLRLTDGFEDSDFVYWIVVDCHESYEALGDGTVRCSFSSANAVPTSLNWNYNVAYETGPNGPKRVTSSNSNYIIFKTDLVSAADRAAGSVTGTFEPGTFDLRMAYQTEYGLFWSDVQAVTLT